MKHSLTFLLVSGLGLITQLASAQLPNATPSRSALPAAGSLVISNVNVVDVEGSRILPSRTVVILDGCIVSVGTRAPAGRAVQRIDGQGKYLIPGLWDARTHALATAAEERIALPLYVAQGITSIRSTATQRPLSELQATVRAVENGERVGPRIELAGASLASSAAEPGLRFPVTFIQGQEQATALLEKGWRAVQTAALLPQPAFLGVASVTQAWRRPLAGPVPEALTVLQAVAAGQSGIELADKLLLGCSTREEEMVAARRHFLAQATPASSWSDLAYKQRSSLVASFSGARCTALGQALVEAHTFVIPLLRATETAQKQELAAGFSGLRFVPTAVRSRWTQAPGSQQRYSAAELAQRKTITALRHQMLAEFQRQHVVILAGSDAGWSTPYSFHGSSLLEELEYLVAAGLTPAQALFAATVAPAAATGHRFEQGQIAVDFHGDLVLLDANPLEDISHLRQVRAVVLRGRLFDRAALTALTVEAERAARQGKEKSTAAN
jgi:hypothetical protein